MDLNSIKRFLVENRLHRGEDYVRLCKALWEKENVVARQIAEAGASAFPKHHKLARLKSKTSPKGRKVFGIGLSKTGTTSLTHALEGLGYRAAHWRKMPEKKILGWEHIDQYDALTDISISFIMEPLYLAYPDALFVYTVRQYGAWERSIERHFNWLGGFDGLKSKILENGAHTRPVEHQALWRQIHLALYARYSSWREAYAAHEERVFSFFDGTRRDSLLTLDITKGSSSERWEKLCGFLGEDIPLFPIPHSNPRSTLVDADTAYTEDLRALIALGSQISDQQIGLARGLGIGQSAPHEEHG